LLRPLLLLRARLFEVDLLGVVIVIVLLVIRVNLNVVVVRAAKEVVNCVREDVVCDEDAKLHAKGWYKGESESTARTSNGSLACSKKLKNEPGSLMLFTSFSSPSSSSRVRGKSLHRLCASSVH
jgi:hypothetical protein